MHKFVKRKIRRLAIKTGVLIHQVNRQIARETLPKFGNMPKNLRIDLPKRITNPDGSDLILSKFQAAMNGSRVGTKCALSRWNSVILLHTQMSF